MQIFDWVVDRAKFEAAVEECGAKATEAEIKAAYVKRLGLVRGDPSTAVGVNRRTVVNEVVTEVSATKGAIELAAENNIDLAKVKGTGRDGTITKGDVEALIQ